MELPGEFSLKKRVGIIGGNHPDPVSLRFAEETGSLIAEEGYLLVNGGMGGIMEASAKGARSKNGFVLSILPGLTHDSGNAYSSLSIATGLGYIRNPLVVLNSDILVAIDGSYGTLSEIAYAKIYGKKVLGLNTWEVEGIESFETPAEIIAAVKDHFKSS